MLLLATPCAVHHRYGRIYTYRQYLGRRVYSVTLQFSKAEAEGKRKGKVHKSHVTNLAAPFNEAVGSITIPSTATTAKYNCKIQLQNTTANTSTQAQLLRSKGGKGCFMIHRDSAIWLEPMVVFAYLSVSRRKMK